VSDGQERATIPDYVVGNRARWQHHAAEYVEPAEQAWQSDQPYWGIWQLAEADVGVLPFEIAGLDCIELGCGAGYVSAWLARRGGNAVGIDPTPNQLATARAMMGRFGPEFPLIEGIAEALPFQDDTFDLAISEYGAALWSDPYLWIAEAARVLRPGGHLIFITNSIFQAVCADEDENVPLAPHLQRPYLGMHTTTWLDSPGETEFHLPHGVWIELLRESGFVVERLLELGAPPGAVSRYPWASAEFAASWPTEEVWHARLAG